MHWALRLRELDNLEKDIVSVLVKARGALSQTQIVERSRLGRSQATVSRAMARLVNEGVIAKDGTTRNASFALTDLVDRFARPPQLRSPVAYDPYRIGNYVPNETTWLPAAERNGMEMVASSIEHTLDASTYSREIAERFLIDLSWASSALEGNTYDYLATEVLLRYGEKATGHDLIEATMILNHKHAISELLERVDQPALDTRSMSRIHALLMRDLISPEDLGRVRANDVRISATSYRPSADHVQLEADLGSLLWKAEQIENPFEASFFLLAGFSYLQAFIDGNKRMGRLACSMPLLAKGLPPVSFVGVDRSAYLTGLIVFYETGDTSLLAEAVSHGYEVAAPTYAAAVSTRRIPRSVEVRERRRIETTVQSMVAESIEAGTMVEADRVREALIDLGEDDREVLVTRITEILETLSDTNAIAWGVDESDAALFIQVRNDDPKHENTQPRGPRP